MDPEIKLFPFCGGWLGAHEDQLGFPVTDMDVAVNNSEQLRGLHGIMKEWMERWARGWMGS